MSRQISFPAFTVGFAKRFSENFTTGQLNLTKNIASGNVGELVSSANALKLKSIIFSKSSTFVTGNNTFNSINPNLKIGDLVNADVTYYYGTVEDSAFTTANSSKKEVLGNYVDLTNIGFDSNIAVKILIGDFADGELYSTDSGLNSLWFRTNASDSGTSTNPSAKRIFISAKESENTDIATTVATWVAQINGDANFLITAQQTSDNSIRITKNTGGFANNDISILSLGTGENADVSLVPILDFEYIVQSGGTAPSEQYVAPYLKMTLNVPKISLSSSELLRFNTILFFGEGDLLLWASVEGLQDIRRDADFTREYKIPFDILSPKVF